MVVSVITSWLACVGAFFALTFTPLADTSDWKSILVIGTLWWVFGLLVKPVLKLILFPFNVISYGFIGIVVEYFVVWLLFWLIPAYQLNNIVLMGWSITGWWLLFVASLAIAILQKIFLAILRYNT